MTQAILVKKISENEWLFVASEAVTEVTLGPLTEAEELMEVGKAKSALKILTHIATEVPDCLEVYNDLYICRCMLRQYEIATKELKKDAARTILLLPPEMFQKDQRLGWGYLENRPFMRLYGNLGEALLEEGEFKKAQRIFEQLLAWNPNDNQGMREHLLDCYLELQNFKGIVSLAKRYPGDRVASNLTYALPIALCLLGKVEEAKKALKKAAKCLPNVAIELLKKKHNKPAGRDDGWVVVGGEDQAYQYWKEYGDYWKRPECASLLEELV